MSSEDKTEKMLGKLMEQLKELKTTVTQQAQKFADAEATREQQLKDLEERLMGPRLEGNGADTTDRTTTVRAPEAELSQEAANLLQMLHKTVPLFHYDKELGTNFEEWYENYASLLEEQASSVPETNRIRFLLSRLQPAEEQLFKGSALAAQFALDYLNNK